MNRLQLAIHILKGRPLAYRLVMTELDFQDTKYLIVKECRCIGKKQNIIHDTFELKA